MVDEKGCAEGMVFSRVDGILVRDQTSLDHSNSFNLPLDGSDEGSLRLRNSCWFVQGTTKAKGALKAGERIVGAGRGGFCCQIDDRLDSGSGGDGLFGENKSFELPIKFLIECCGGQLILSTNRRRGMA